MQLGHICCRFEDGSPYLRGLGNYFLSQQRGNFVPFFEIESDLNAAPDFRVSRASEKVFRF